MSKFLSKLFKDNERNKLWSNFTLILLLLLFLSPFAISSYYNRGMEWMDSKVGFSLATTSPDFKLGLDLQGGAHLVYKADVSQVESSDRSSALEGARDVIEQRVNAFGVGEPVIQTSISPGEYRLIVELAGVKDINEAIKMIGETPLLEFKEMDNTLPDLSDDQKAEISAYNLLAKNRADEVLEKLTVDGDFSDLAVKYSDDANTKDAGGSMGWISSDENARIVGIVSEYEIGQSSTNLIESDVAYEIFKLDDKREVVDAFDETKKEKEVKASHLLLCYDGIEGCETGLSKEDTYKKIKEIKEEASPDNFARLVKENSTEPGATSREGDLGWFRHGMMLKPFEDAVFEQEVGTISYVVETQFGYHLIYKQDERNLMEYNVSRILFNKKTKESILGPQTEWKNTELSGKNLDKAIVTRNPNDGSPEVSLQFDGEGADMFADITTRNVGKQVAIFLDGRVISAPTVNEKITGGRAVISGNFGIQEAQTLSQRLNAGALPLPIELISQQTVGPTLGEQSLVASLKAGFIGLLLVALFMILYYRLPGIVAVTALLVYGFLLLAILKILNVTLTLSGLAGFILSIGMAVDANVLIFERLKEEIKRGQPMSRALALAFDRAWLSIRDGNISTLITCFILIFFSTGTVRGFAITLSLGVIVSMFSSMIVTKNLLYLVSVDWLKNKTWLYGVKKTN